MKNQEALTLFDTYALTVPEGLKVHADELPGQRRLSLSDEKGSVLISFVENMELMDLKPLSTTGDATTHSYQCCRDGKYIHLRRSTSAGGSFGYFHIELEDAEGRTLSLPGQITANSAYSRRDGIDPILLELMDGLTLL